MVVVEEIEEQGGNPADHGESLRRLPSEASPACISYRQEAGSTNFPPGVDWFDIHAKPIHGKRHLSPLVRRDIQKELAESPKYKV